MNGSRKKSTITSEAVSLNSSYYIRFSESPLLRSEDKKIPSSLTSDEIVSYQYGIWHKFIVLFFIAFMLFSGYYSYFIPLT